MPDLFGNEVPDRALTPLERRRLEARHREGPKYRANGYAAPPGSGPDGKTCKGCLWFRRNETYNRTFLKCGHESAPKWTHSYGTDIRATAPACRHWADPSTPP
jgi:hypothetical protein